MDCKSVQIHLHDYLLKKVDPILNKQIVQHVKKCPQCSAELKQIRLYYDAIHHASPVAPPHDFLEQTMNRIANSQPFHKRIIEFLFMPFHYKLPIEACGLVLVAFILFLLYRPDVQLNEGHPVSVIDEVSLHKPREISSSTSVKKTRSTEVKQVRRNEMERTIAISEDTSIAQLPSLAEQKEDRTRAQEENSEITIVLNIEPAAIKQESEKAERKQATAESKRVFRSSSKDYASGMLMSQSPKKLDNEDQRIHDLVTTYNGRIIKSTQTKDFNNVIIQLPQKHYSAFLNDLGRISIINQAPSLPSKKQSEKMEVTIQLKQ